ncbi:arylalkylamine N-acetyltransferase-like 2 [Musca vetustissima]|uniref:arylalkylamine N-acetyltransferase-like 2 n=1 Tax=Musca vetustissima TaxID=27455 RepID=UPI002AB664BB|nr:arylalkylamine N-acetyltransferase-like 2 [Musca vetustissima]
MALEKAEIIGVSIALPKNHASIGEYFEAAQKAGKTKHGYIMQLFGEIILKTDVFKRYGVEEVLYLYIASVAPNQRGRNIGALMLGELMQLAKEKNYKVLTADCSSYYCAKVCERMGMECLSTVAFADYLNEEGEVIFKPPAPHVAMKTYAKRV